MMKKPAEENWMLWLLQMVNLNWENCFSFELGAVHKLRYVVVVGGWSAKVLLLKLLIR